MSSSSSSSSNSKKIITFRCSDNEIFELDEVATLQSQTIKHMIEDGCADNIIPLTTVQSKIFAMVVEYCKQHTNNDDSDAMKKWDEEFIDVDQPTLFELIHAANFMSIKGLLELTCKTVADIITKDTPKEIRGIFNIHNDFTPEEEEAFRRQNQWTFDE